MKVLLLSGIGNVFIGEYSGSQAAKLESRFQTPRAGRCVWIWAFGLVCCRQKSQMQDLVLISKLIAEV